MSHSRTVTIVLAILVIIGLACSSSTTSTPTPEPTPTSEPPPTQEPTEPPPTFKPEATATRTPTPRPAATATRALSAGVLFTDDFRSQQASEDKGWSTESSENVDWSWEADGLFTSVHKKQTIGWNSPDGTFDDFGAEIEAVSVGSGYAEYGLIFRVSGDKDARSYYLFAVTTDGKYYVDKLIDGDWADPSPVPKTTSQYVKKGKTKNTVGVLAEGPKISLYINRFLIKTITDDSLSEGEIGLFAATGDNDLAQVAFSRMTVTTVEKARADWGTTPASGGSQPTAAPTKSSGGGGTGNGTIVVRNTFPGACQVNLWGQQEAVIRAEGKSSASKSLPPGIYGAHVAVDIGEVDLSRQFTLPPGGTCVITCDAATKSVYNSCK